MLEFQYSRFETNMSFRTEVSITIISCSTDTDPE